MTSPDHETFQPWTVTGSRHVLRDRWISVRADDCVTAEGVEIAPYYVLEYPDWVIVVAIDDQDRIILVEQYRHGWGIMSLELPTGGVEPGDADPVASAARELAEETGYVSSDWHYLTALAPNPSNMANKCHFLLARSARQMVMPEDDPTERLRVVPCPVEEVVAMAKAGTIVQSMHVAALAMVLSSIGRWS
jgi:8-oxo-dGTP pyrophosphatase MutT (NUDIX family)